MKKAFTTILLILVLLIMAVPMLQHIFHFGDDGKLDGHVVNTADVNFSLKGWWDGSYQYNKTNYLNDSMGFRPWIVRMNNEIDYRLLGRLHAMNVVIGKENCMYEQAYIDAYCGKANADYAVVQQQLYRLKKIQDTMAHMGIDFVFIIAPSKARFYPEYFPAGCDCREAKDGIYHKFVRVMDSLGINYIDFNGWMVKMKDTSTHLLMSKQGIHWTTYAGMLAGDSLVTYMEQKRHSHMRQLVMERNERTVKDRNNDADIAKGLNLLFHLPTTDTFTYPVFSYTPEDSTTDKPAAIYLGDSFVWTYRSFWLQENVHKDWEIWFYLREVWSNDAFYGKESAVSFEGYNWQKAVEGTDIFIIQYTEPGLLNFTNGFIDKAYDYYYGDLQ